MTTACIGPALNLIGHIVHHFAINAIDMGRIVAVFFGLVEQQLAQALVAFEIRVAGGDELIHCHVCCTDLPLSTQPAVTMLAKITG